jgi:hypothetical protein
MDSQESETSFRSDAEQTVDGRPCNRRSGRVWAETRRLLGQRRQDSDAEQSRSVQPGEPLVALHPVGGIMSMTLILHQIQSSCGPKRKGRWQV